MSLRTMASLSILWVTACSSTPSATDAAVDVVSVDAVSVDAAVPLDRGQVDASAPPADSGLPVACDGLGSFCHEVASGSAALTECHDVGHSSPSPMWCASNHARCYALCLAARNARDGGADASHSDHDAAGDASHSDHDAAGDASHH